MSLFEKIRAHRGHRIEVAVYGPLDDPVNAAVECMTCSEVIVDEDAPWVDAPRVSVTIASQPR